MTEACDAVTGYWFDILKFPALRVPKAIANEASRRISLKQGMRIVAMEERNFASGRLPAEIWETTAEEWRTRVRSETNNREAGDGRCKRSPSSLLRP